MSHHIRDPTELEAKLVEAGDNLVVIDFSATWCGPCKKIAPKFEELATMYPDVLFLKIDVDECDTIATEYDISSMPTFVFIKNKSRVAVFSGANYDLLKETILKHMQGGEGGEESNPQTIQT